MEGKIETCRWCRTNKKPFLGVCLGFQTAVIEFARNVLKLENAHTSECDNTVEHPVIIDMPEHNTGDMGGTMRLGKRTTVFKASAVHSKISKYKFLFINGTIVAYSLQGGFMAKKMKFKKGIATDTK